MAIQNANTNFDAFASTVNQISPCIDDEKQTDKEIAWFSGSKMMMKDIKPTFKNLKEEVLNNKFASISKRSWNDTLTKCQSIYKEKVQSFKIKQWSQYLKQNNIGMKELIALKLYCDYDALQREFRKCFRSPFNQNMNRLSSFYWWNKTLSKAFKKFNDLKSRKTYNVLFHGISSIMSIDNVKGTYFGPLSTTTDIRVARSFAGEYGMILVIEPDCNDPHNEYKPFDISYLSDFPDESEVLCFDQSYCIKDVILSSEFDTKAEIRKNYKFNGNNGKMGETMDNMDNVQRVPKLSISESTESAIGEVFAVV